MRAEAWNQAVGYLRQAGPKAAGRSAYRQAAAAFEEALAALGHLPETRVTLEAAVDLRIDLRDVLIPLDEMARVLDHQLAAAPQADQLGDPARMGWVASGLVNTLFTMAQYRRALAEGARALDLADRLPDTGLRDHAPPARGDKLGARRFRASAGVSSPEPGAGRRRAVAPAASGHDSLPGVMARVWLAVTESETGRFPEAIQLAEEAGRIVRSADQPFSRGAALWALGHARLRRGDLAEAAPALEEGLEVARTWNLLTWYPIGVATLGHASTLTGRHPEAVALLEDAVRQGSSRRAEPSHLPPRVARGGPPPCRPRPRGAITGHGSARSGRDARGAWQPGVDPAPPRRDRGPGRPS